MEGSKLYIANFFEGLTEAGPARPEVKSSPAQPARPPSATAVAAANQAFAATCARILQYPEDLRFDLVLVWDLFNYLSLAEVETLAQRLVALSRPGTRIMALVSIQKKIPDRPFRFVIRDKDSLRYEVVSSGLRDCPRHNEPDLLKRMVGFKVERGMLLRNGIREYSFVRDETTPVPVPAATRPPRSRSPHHVDLRLRVPGVAPLDPFRRAAAGVRRRLGETVLAGLDRPSRRPGRPGKGGDAGRRGGGALLGSRLPGRTR
jgi:hypothetical protein